MLISRDRSQLLVVDVQERLVPAIFDVQSVVTNVARLIRYASLLHIPTTYTEHMPEQIGHVLPRLSKATGDSTSIVQKKTFSAAREPEFSDRLEKLKQHGRDSILVCGMEAHVCVMQTVLELHDNNYKVHVVADAIGSRSDHNRDLAVDRMSKAGVTIVSHEMVAFEWLERGDAPEFKDILKLLK